MTTTLLFLLYFAPMLICWSFAFHVYKGEHRQQLDNEKTKLEYEILFKKPPTYKNMEETITKVLLVSSLVPIWNIVLAVSIIF